MAAGSAIGMANGSPMAAANNERRERRETLQRLGLPFVAGLLSPEDEAWVRQNAPENLVMEWEFARGMIERGRKLQPVIDDLRKKSNYLLTAMDKTNAGLAVIIEALHPDPIKALAAHTKAMEERMGTADLRSAFNLVARPKFDATKATLGYTRHDGVESQVLKFYGKRQDGSAFEASSGPLAASVDVNLAARAVAQRLIDELQP